VAQTFHRYRPGDKPVAGYKLIRKLGAGGFGEVWQATAPGGAEVALKFIDLTGTQGFREFRSLRLVKKIRHSNLTPLHGFWLKNADETLFDESDATWSHLESATSSKPSPAFGGLDLFTKPVELIVAMGLGEQSLYDRLHKCEKAGLSGIPPEELLDYIADAAKGIDYLNKPQHDLGNGLVPILHCDVKPHNILIVGDTAQVCDFGLAHAVETLRKTCTTPLTMAYAAPESFRGKPSDKSDQYSLGITYVEVRTGCLPFDENLTGYEVMTAHVQGQLDFSRLPPAEAAVIRRATAVRPEDRWASCREMAQELAAAVRSPRGSTPAPSPPSAPVPLQTSKKPAAPAPAPTKTPPNQSTRETPANPRVTPPKADPALKPKPRGVPPPIPPAAKKPVAQKPVANKVAPARRRPTSTAVKLKFSLLLLCIAIAVGVYVFITSNREPTKINRPDRLKPTTKSPATTDETPKSTKAPPRSDSPVER
jgi:serine/threonine protein kinase